MENTLFLITFCRINFFYDVAFCVSLECCDYEDVMEIITRLKTLAPNLTPSHEVRNFSVVYFNHVTVLTSSRSD